MPGLGSDLTILSLASFVIRSFLGFPGGVSGRESDCQCRRHESCGFDPWVRDNPLEEDMVTHSSILVWRIPMGRRVWWTKCHRGTKNQTQLKGLNMQACTGEGDEQLFV